MMRMRKTTMTGALCALGLALAFLLGAIGIADAGDKGGDKKGPAIAAPQPQYLLGPLDEVAKAGGWTGFHVDAAVGYHWTRSEFETQWDGGKTIDADNLLLTAGAGWDAQIGNVVLGIMADVTASDLDNTEWQWFVGARGGVLVSPKTLVYGLVGYTETIDGQLAFKVIDATRFKDIAGLTYGGGLEHIVAQGWSLKAEYRYVQFGDETAPSGVIDGLKDGTDVESGAHQVRFGISKRF